jgi:hypothetical protein
MKKTILFVAMALGLSTAFAQDLTSKKGEKYLPESGDWAIGADATPFLDYVGNFFGKTGPNVSPTMSFANGGMMLQGKMFKDDKTAYRVGLRIGFGSLTTHNAITSLGDSLGLAKDISTSEMNIGLSAGLEKRKGAGRLQGFYGAEAGLAFGGGGTVTNTYAMELNSARNAAGGGPLVASRTAETVTGSVFMFGIRGFAGVEYFVLPKISIAGEFGWGLSFATTGDDTKTDDSVSGTPGALVAKSTTTTTEGPSAFVLDTDNNNQLFGPVGSLRIIFHFQ